MERWNIGLKLFLTLGTLGILVTLGTFLLQFQYFYPLRQVHAKKTMFSISLSNLNFSLLFADISYYNNY